MTFEFHVYPKRGLILKGTEAQICSLIEQGILEERSDGLAQFTKGINLSIVQLGVESLEKFIDEQWIPLFPTGEINSGTGSYRVTGNRKEIIRRMREFLKQYKTRFDYDCIFISTAAYLYDRAQVNFNYTAKCQNFINRELEAWCLAYEQNPQELFQKAKLYYEYVRRTATRARKKRVDATGFGRSSILERTRLQDNSGELGAGHRPVGESSGSDNGQSDNRHLQPRGTIKLGDRAIRINKAHKGGAGNKGSSS